MTAKRSASKPARLWARQASHRPSGETTGCWSAPGFEGVRSRGSPEPSIGVVQRSKLVLQASSLGSSLAEKITDAPSGVMTKSLSSPKGLEGTSPSKPDVKATGAPVAAPEASNLMANSRLRVPLAQASQWRMKRRSWTTPDGLPAARSSSRRLVQSRPSQSGKTPRATTMPAPSGLSRKATTSSGSRVTCSAARPSRSVRQIWSEPERGERK